MVNFCLWIFCSWSKVTKCRRHARAQSTDRTVFFRGSLVFVPRCVKRWILVLHWVLEYCFQSWWKSSAKAVRKLVSFSPWIIYPCCLLLQQATAAFQLTSHRWDIVMDRLNKTAKLKAGANYSDLWPIHSNKYRVGAVFQDFNS